MSTRCVEEEEEQKTNHPVLMRSWRIERAEENEDADGRQSSFLEGG
jgi:hypothetical protein